MNASATDLTVAMLVGHQVGDHLAQTDHQAAHKAGKGAEGWRAMAGHVAGYTACQAVALAGLSASGRRVSVGRAAVAVAISAGTHAFIDRRWPVQAVLRATRAEGFAALSAHGLNGAYLADQALHVGCIYAAALVAAGGK